jgi:hypothetical protein
LLFLPSKCLLLRSENLNWAFFVIVNAYLL